MKFLILLNNIILFSIVVGGQGATLENVEAPLTEASVAVPPSASEKKYEIFNNIPKCSQSDANLNDCLKHVFDVMINSFKDGNEELNIASIDPFTLNRTTFEYVNGAIKGRITIKDSLIYGFPETKVKDLDFKINEDKVKYRAKLFVPALNIIGNYKADVDFNNVKIKPHAEVNIAEVAEGELYEKDGHQFMRLIKIDVNPDINNLNINATGLFPDSNLSDLVLGIANQYWRQIYGIMLPETKKYWAPMLLRLMNESFAEVPFDLIVKKK